MKFAQPYFEFEIREKTASKSPPARNHHGPIKFHRRQDQEGEDHANQAAARGPARRGGAVPREVGEKIAEAGQGRQARDQETRQSGRAILGQRICGAREGLQAQDQVGISESEARSLLPTPPPRTTPQHTGYDAKPAAAVQTELREVLRGRRGDAAPHRRLPPADEPQVGRRDLGLL